MIPVSAILQIAILYLAIYAVLKGARGSRFGQALTGIGLLAALLIAFSYLFHFDVLTKIVKFLLVYIAVSSVVIFQPEIRRILSAVGAFGYLERPKHNADGSATPELVTETILALAAQKTGALIAFERGISLRSYASSGVTLDAVFTRELVRTIFTPPLPLHDGGLVVRDGRIASAHALFPVSNNPALIDHGMRHRAAVGLSEETDALVIVVSEETGDVSVAHNGRLLRYTGEAAASAVQRWVTSVLRRDAHAAGLLGPVAARAQRLLLKLTKGNG